MLVLLSLVTLCVGIAGSYRYRNSHLEQHNPREIADGPKRVVLLTQPSGTHDESYQERVSNISPLEPAHNTGRGLENVGKHEELLYNTGRGLENVGEESAGYIIVFVYSGQQGSGMRALLSLQCWAASFSLPVHIVEPFIERSTFTMRVETKNISSLMRFSDFYDIKHFSNVSYKNGLPSVVPWENFIRYASKNIVVVTVSSDPASCQDHNSSEVVEDLGDGGQCSHSQEWLLNSRLFAEVDLCVVRVVFLTERCLFINPQAAQKMYDNIFKGWDPRNITVVFRSWPATWDRLSSPYPGSRDCRDTDGRKLKYRFHPSGRLVRDAQRYRSMFLKGDGRVAVMIRTEQTVMGASETSQDSFQSMVSCLQETVQTARSLTHSTASQSSSGIFLTLDIGKYGSKSLEEILVRKAGRFKIQATYEAIMKSVKDVVPQLFDGKWTFTEWENSFAEATSGVENPGYIASLQRTIASQADCLVLMGGGDYQRLALVEYLENHPSVSKQCVHFVCLRPGHLNQFRRLMDQD